MVRVACIGDSITYGYGIDPPASRNEFSYPGVLASILPEDCEVFNFAANGLTMRKSANNPLWTTDYYEQALSSSPDIVVLMLGTNDAQHANRASSNSDFIADATELIQNFKNLDSSPNVFLSQPPPLYPGSMSFLFNATLINEVYSPLFAELANDNAVELIDVFGAMGGMDLSHPEWFLDDGTHPTEVGYTIIAETVRNSVEGTVSAEARLASSAWLVVALALVASSWTI